MYSLSALRTHGVGGVVRQHGYRPSWTFSVSTPGTQSPGVLTPLRIILRNTLYVRFTSCFTKGLDASTQGLDA